jgi:Lipid A 3-O-deacylase (PagL)
MYKFYSLMVVFVAINMTLKAQSTGKYIFESAVHFGTVVRHSPKITIQSNQAVLGAELSLFKQTNGTQAWQQLRHYPKTGLTLCYLNMGEGAHGQGIALLPNISVHVIKNKKFPTDFRIGGGLGYVSKPYDSFSNPRQNAIGSHLNGSMQARIGTQIRLNAHWQMQISACLTHFSNGSSALPNYGINIPTGQIAINYSKKAQTSFIQQENLSKKAQKHWGLQLNLGTASVEYVVIDGPRYPVWSSALAATYLLNKVNKLGVGVDYEFNRSVYEWGLYSTSFPTSAIAKKSSMRVGTFISDEFLFGNASILVHLGVYQGKNFNKYVLTPYYTKVGLRYYLPKILGITRPFVGVYLKTHKAIAEYISFNVGMSF